MGLWTLLESAARDHASRPAIVDGDERASYGALHAETGALALELAARGVRAGDRVALLAENSADFLRASFACAGLGAILVPLNHRLAVPELAFVLADAGARALVATRAFAEQASGVGAAAGAALDTLWLDERPARAAAVRFVPAPVAEDEVAQLYYTSGTTGRAKGVPLTHRNVGRHAESAVIELALAPTDRWAHVAPMFHLADAWATFAITAVGGAHVFVPRFEPEDVLRVMERERVTITNLIPTMLNALVKHPAAERYDLASMRLVLSGGAPIAPALVRRVLAVFGCDYVQTYGMTETSPYLLLCILPPRLRTLPEDERVRLLARTGRPFRGVELEVVDESGRPVPRDDRSVGEIRVRGETVCAGYWKRPEETASAFRDGWLYTGDLAVVDEHGLVDIVDRRKDMIITGGENVYSTEVENALYEHPAVLEAAVFGVPDERWGERVSAAVVARDGHALDDAELAAFCRERIAGYKVPRRFEHLAALPRTGSGKIDKRALRQRFRPS